MPADMASPKSPPWFPYDSFEECLLVSLEEWLDQKLHVREREQIGAPDSDERSRLYRLRRQAAHAVRVYLDQVGLIGLQRTFEDPPVCKRCNERVERGPDNKWVHIVIDREQTPWRIVGRYRRCKPKEE